MTENGEIGRGTIPLQDKKKKHRSDRRCRCDTVIVHLRWRPNVRIVGVNSTAVSDNISDRYQ